MIEWLLAHGANVHKQDRDGRTPLDRAALVADPRNDAAPWFPETAEAPARARRRGHHPRRCRVATPPASASWSRPTCTLAPHQPQRRLLTLAVNHGQIESCASCSILAPMSMSASFSRNSRSLRQAGACRCGTPRSPTSRDRELLLDRGADPNANVYASGWPLRNAWGHKDGLLKKLLLDRGARLQPYMVAEAHDVAEAARLLGCRSERGMARELSGRRRDHGCPAILELALPLLPGRLERSAWHWVIIQPIRGARRIESIPKATSRVWPRC